MGRRHREDRREDQAFQVLYWESRLLGASNMEHSTWEVIRAYAPTFIVTILALLGVWKDAPDYIDRVRGLGALAKRVIVWVLLLFTVLVSAFGIGDIHSGRAEAGRAASDREKSDAQIQSLQNQVKGLRQDGIANTQTFTDSLSSLSTQLSDLKAKVRSQDLMDQLASTQAELKATQKKLEPKPRATVESSLAEGLTGETPVTVAWGKVDKGVVTLHLVLYNPSDVDGLNGTLKVFICDVCKFAEEPASFTHMTGDKDQVRTYDFQHVFSKTRVPDMTFKISVPDPGVGMDLKTITMCETCDHQRTELFKISLIR
jgi:hypothetical protein